MMFIELMFWKPAPVAQLVKEEYNWRVEPQASRIAACATMLCMPT